MLLALLACTEPVVEDSVIEADTDTDADADSDTDTDADTDPHEIGRPLPPFALEDLNPASASYGRVVSDSDFEASYAVIFLDSRCVTCAEVAQDLWDGYEQHPEWDLPLVAVQSITGGGDPDAIEHMVGGHGLPYLLDTDEVALWSTYQALNHDFYVVSSEGTLEVWIPLYSWPEDLELFEAYMTDRHSDAPG
jgi:hypothetical protein